MLENALLNWIMPFIAPALVVNIFVDMAKYLTTETRPKWVLPLVCGLFSAIAAGIYAIISEELPQTAFNQACAIMGISFFFYSVGGYGFLKKIFLRVFERKGENDNQN